MEGQDLGAPEAGNPVLTVNPIEEVPEARPCQGSGGPAGRSGFVVHLEGVRPRLANAREVFTTVGEGRVGADPPSGCQVAEAVPHHGLHRLRLQDATLGARSVIEDHPHEGGVVLGGGVEAPAAVLDLRWSSLRHRGNRDDFARWLALMHRGGTVGHGIGHMECGVVHAQRVEDPFAEDLPKALTTHGLD